jgi:hypothetical protein
MDARWAGLAPWDYAGIPETRHLPCWRVWITTARGVTAKAQSELDNKREASRRSGRR